jgi:hemerythrin-like domain-containing protein
MTREPTDVLREEHALILRALDMLEVAAVRTAAGGPVEGGWWGQALEWLRGFADRNHHAKEEVLLFPALEQAGIPNAGGPIGVMLREHTEGRALIAAMETGPDRAASARAYVGLLRAHIDKENGVLFPLADTVLGDDTRVALARDFAEVADRLGREASLAEAAADLASLEARLGVPASALALGQ